MGGAVEVMCRIYPPVTGSRHPHTGCSDSWPLDNTGLNCKALLALGTFSMNLTAGLGTYKPQMQNRGQGGPTLKVAPRVSCVALSPGTPGQCGQVTAAAQTWLPRQGPSRFCTTHGSTQAGVAGLRT